MRPQRSVKVFFSVFIIIIIITSHKRKRPRFTSSEQPKNMLLLLICMISHDDTRFHPLILPSLYFLHLHFSSSPFITFLSSHQRIQLPPLKHGMSKTLAHTNFVSHSHMSTCGGPEYSHLPVFPMSHRATGRISIEHNAYTHTQQMHAFKPFTATNHYQTAGPSHVKWQDNSPCVCMTERFLEYQGWVGILSPEIIF